MDLNELIARINFKELILKKESTPAFTEGDYFDGKHIMGASKDISRTSKDEFIAQVKKITPEEVSILILDTNETVTLKINESAIISEKFEIKPLKIMTIEEFRKQ